MNTKHCDQCGVSSDFYPRYMSHAAVRLCKACTRLAADAHRLGPQRPDVIAAKARLAAARRELTAARRAVRRADRQAAATRRAASRAHIVTADVQAGRIDPFKAARLLAES